MLFPGDRTEEWSFARQRGASGWHAAIGEREGEPCVFLKWMEIRPRYLSTYPVPRVVVFGHRRGSPSTAGVFGEVAGRGSLTLFTVPAGASRPNRALENVQGGINHQHVRWVKKSRGFGGACLRRVYICSRPLTAA